MTFWQRGWKKVVLAVFIFEMDIKLTKEKVKVLIKNHYDMLFISIINEVMHEDVNKLLEDNKLDGLDDALGGIDNLDDILEWIGGDNRDDVDILCKLFYFLGYKCDFEEIVKKKGNREAICWLGDKVKDDNSYRWLMSILNGYDEMCDGEIEVVYIYLYSLFSFLSMVAYLAGKYLE